MIIEKLNENPLSNYKICEGSLAVSSPVGGRGFYFYDEKICDRTTDMETTLFISLGKFM